MNNKKLSRLLEPNLKLYFLCMIVFAAATATVSLPLGLVEIACTVGLYAYFTNRNQKRRQNILQYIDNVTGSVDTASKSTLINSPLPIMVFRPDTGEVIWSNENFLQLAGVREHLFEMKVEDAVPDFPVQWMLEGKQETYFEQWMRLATEVKSAADSADEDGEILRKIELLMSDSSFMSLDRPEDKADQKVDEELMAGKLERFFGELSAAWEGKPKVLVRAVMSKILSRLPVFFDSLEEVRLYVEGSLRSCSDVKEKEISMGLIRMLMEQDKFDQEDY